MIERVRPDTPFVATLRAELRALDEQALKHNEALRLLEKKRQLIQTLIIAENPKPLQLSFDTERETSIAEVLVRQLMKGPTSKESLNKAAETAGFPSSGRSVHATLMNFVKSGHATRTSDDTFSLTESGKEALSLTAEGSRRNGGVA